MTKALTTPWTERQKGTAVGLIILANFIQSISVGINVVVFTTALDSYGASTSVIGLVMAVEYISVFGISMGLPWLLRVFSLRGGLEISTLFRLPALLLLCFLTEPRHWALVVFMHGIGNFLFGILLQTWINSIPFTRNRGLVMGLFGTSISLGLALGPVLLAVASYFPEQLSALVSFTDQYGKQWFGWTVPAAVSVQTRMGLVLSALLSTLAVLPVLLGRSMTPRNYDEPKVSMPSVVRRAPAAMYAVMLCGFTILGLQSFITVYGLRNGLNMRDASYLLTAFMIGSISLEAPIASLSDRFDRRYVMIALVLLSLVAAVYLPMAVYYRWSAWALLFIWGGMIGALFSICLALVAERFNGPDLVAANGAFSIMDNLGGLLGVLAMGFGMDMLGEDGFPYAIMFASVVYFSFALTRYQVR